jgi:hypothetical protein
MASGWSSATPCGSASPASSHRGCRPSRSRNALVAPTESARNRAIERLRHARLAPSASEAGLDDLELLGVERQRAHAAKQEAYESAIQLVMSSIVPQSELATSFLNSFLARVKLTASIHRFVDRRRVREVLHSPDRAPPPVWHPELHQALKIPEGSLHTDSERVLRGVAQRVTAAREEEASHRKKVVEQSAQERVSQKRKRAEWERKSPAEREEQRRREMEPREHLRESPMK